MEKRKNGPTKKEKIEKYLKTNGLWKSHYVSVNNLLFHLHIEKSGSLASRNRLLSVLYDFCLHLNKNPDELLLLDIKMLEIEIRKYLTNRYNWKRSLKTQGQALKTFFTSNDIEDIKFPKIYIHTRERKTPEHIPTKKEAWKMAEYAGSLKARAIILCLKSSGCRSSTLAAIKYGEIRTKHMKFKNFTIKNQIKNKSENFVFIIEDGMKEDNPDACKNRIPYYTFTSKEATEAVILYLEDRKRKYGKIDDDEFLFPSNVRGRGIAEDVRTPISDKGIWKVVKEAAKRAGIENSSYVSPQKLRKTFYKIVRETHDGIREKQGLDDKEQEFLMGHILGGTRDFYFDKDKIEELREKYLKLSFKPEQDARKERLIGSALSHGFDWDDIINEAKKRTNGNHTLDDIDSIIKEKIKNKNRPKDIVIKIDDIQKYLNKGWSFISNLNNGNAVVRKNGNVDEEKVSS